MIDVTDATFEAEVVKRSEEIPVVVDLWAPWCGPCRTLGPILEKVIDDTEGAVVLAKVNVDENPGVSQAFQVQGIPAVYAMKDGKVVDGFVGAQPEAAVKEFVDKLAPSAVDAQVRDLLALGDEESLREALVLDGDNETVIVALSEILIADGRGDEAIELVSRVPESPATRRIAALARSGADLDDDVEKKLNDLLERVKTDDDARQEFVDLLELLGPQDPRTAKYRKALTARLY